MTGYDHLAAMIDAPGNRHRGKGRACVPIGFQGGRTRYLWLERGHFGQVAVTLFGHTIAAVDPDGSAVLNPCGFYTDCTRDAFGVLLAMMDGDPPANNGRATLHMPGSKGGGEPGRPWSIVLHYRGESFTMTEGDGWLTIPAEGHPTTGVLPIMGQDCGCVYDFDGMDDGLEMWRCTTHDCISIGSAVPCETGQNLNPPAPCGGAS